jgi:hypothetical protein
MHATIGFNDETSGKAGEVDDILSDRNLSSEAKPFKASITDQRPEKFLRASR